MRNFLLNTETVVFFLNFVLSLLFVYYVGSYFIKKAIVSPIFWAILFCAAMSAEVLRFRKTIRTYGYLK